ncbi:HEPN domain-containing protein [Desertivirga arenae]|uniref:HEPN domain-containing protein n=1 Tax=Desertivirga arenae TaxID=2810309 RepID=UPI001A95C7D4|nr:HEPN domain-containing protein [Pedobacter sp. SYSU D00823]
MKPGESSHLPLSPWDKPVKAFAIHHLEAEEAIKELVIDLAARTDIVKLICFAKRMSMTTNISTFDPESTNGHCHYFLMVVTESIERQEHLLQDYVNAHFKLGKITLLAHGMETIEQALANGNRFFTSVFRYGRMLYSRNGLLETVPYIEPDVEKVFEKVALRFEYNNNLAKGFLQAAGSSLDQENNTISMFLLHQAMEQGLTALIRVFMGYRADIHSLGRLQDLCLCFCEEEFLFPRQRPEEQRLFQLLQRSYSGARYKQDFEVNEKDVERIYAEVAAFLKRVEERCEDKLGEMAAAFPSSLN